MCTRAQFFTPLCVSHCSLRSAGWGRHRLRAQSSRETTRRTSLRAKRCYSAPPPQWTPARASSLVPMTPTLRYSRTLGSPSEFFSVETDRQTDRQTDRRTHTHTHTHTHRALCQFFEMLWFVVIRIRFCFEGIGKYEICGNSSFRFHLRAFTWQLPGLSEMTGTTGW